MRIKILATAVVGLMVFISFCSIGFYFVKAQSFSERQVFINENEEEIFKEIEETEDKNLVVDKVIRDRHVKYWQHNINDVLVKHDYILLHLDIENGDVLEYEKTWTDVEIVLPDYRDKVFEPVDYFWKQKVVFPDEDDCSLFYTFYVPIYYPLVCWEVRYTDGTTILYDFDGGQIGHGVPTPWSEGLVIQGYGDSHWYLWKDNAQEWFYKWCDSLQSKSSPDLSWVSERISDPDVELFYVIAHSGGQPDRFLVKNGVYYNATRLHNDMSGRKPIKLAVLCCCSAMEETGPGTLSYEFRKGEMNDTVTIGYFNMAECPGWPWDVLYWQDFMFNKMDKGFRVKVAFDLACAKYPSVDGYVKFVGDENLKVKVSINSVSTSEESSDETVSIQEVEYTSTISAAQSYLVTGETTADVISKGSQSFQGSQIRQLLTRNLLFFFLFRNH